MKHLQGIANIYAKSKADGLMINDTNFRDLIGDGDEELAALENRHYFVYKILKNGTKIAIKRLKDKFKQLPDN